MFDRANFPVHLIGCGVGGCIGYVKIGHTMYLWNFDTGLSLVVSDAKTDDSIKSLMFVQGGN